MKFRCVLFAVDLCAAHNPLTYEQGMFAMCNIFYIVPTICRSIHPHSTNYPRRQWTV